LGGHAILKVNQWSYDTTPKDRKKPQIAKNLSTFTLFDEWSSVSNYLEGAIQNPKNPKKLVPYPMIRVAEYPFEEFRHAKLGF
jgi:hypothetical protein